MAPHSPDQKSVKKFDDELLEKLKQEEEKERKRLEKEAKRREEINKFTKESYERQAALLGKEKPKPNPPKKPTVKTKANSKSKQSSNKKLQNQSSESIFNQRSHYAPSSTVPKTKSYSTAHSTKQQYNNYERTYSQSNFHENAWKKLDSRSVGSRSRHSSVSDSVWGDSDDQFPALGTVVSVPKVNVWEERKSKQEAIKALEPQNEYDEDAMLQQALAMSLLEATKEEERKKKMEEEYIMQLQELQISPEILEDTEELYEFVTSQTEPPYEGFQVSEQHEAKTVTENTASSSNQKVKTYDCGGARPKINKVIDRFGGWGLKDEFKGRNSENNLSNFVDEVVSVKSSRNVDKQKNYESKNVTEHMSKVKDPWETTSSKENESSKNLWDSSNTEDSKKPEVNEESWNDSEILYDEKKTFVDDDNWNSEETEKMDTTLTNVSPNKVLDSWLDSEDTRDNTLNEREELTNDISNNYVSPVSSKDNLDSEDLKDEKKSDSASAYVTDSSSNYELKDSFRMSYTADLSQEIHEYHNSKSDLIDDLSSFNESRKIPSLSIKDIWSDKSPDSSSLFSSFSNSLDSSNANEAPKFSSGPNSEDFNVAISADTDLPPILPPKTPPLVNEGNTMTEISSANSGAEPPILPPQPAPDIPVVPQFPMMGNPLFNPMLPGYNPMLGFGMNPLLTQQMLLLSDPFLASQILAMAQQYRSMGVPVNLFSVPTPVPNASVPGMAYPSMMQNTVTTSANASSDVPLLQKPDNHQFVPKNLVNPEEKLLGNSHQPPELRAFPGIDVPNSVKNEADDSWYKSYLSNDNAEAIPPPQPAVIPPPTPPTHSVNNYSEHVSEPSRLNQSASRFNNNLLGSAQIPNSLDSRLPAKEEESRGLSSAVEAKTEVTGWSDHEDDSPDLPKYKTSSWDDGWGDCAVPAKPLRNISLHDDRKRPVLRQPARQPQISRYQRNKTHN